jgi:hypothetical protein
VAAQGKIRKSEKMRRILPVSYGPKQGIAQNWFKTRELEDKKGRTGGTIPHEGVRY